MNWKAKRYECGGHVLTKCPTLGWYLDNTCLNIGSEDKAIASANAILDPIEWDIKTTSVALAQWHHNQFSLVKAAHTHWILWWEDEELGSIGTPFLPMDWANDLIRKNECKK